MDGILGRRLFRNRWFPSLLSYRRSRHSGSLLSLGSSRSIDVQPAWTEEEKLGKLRPLLYRSFDFYLFVLHNARDKYGRHTAKFFDTELAPTWLSSNTSLSHSITRNEWESRQVSSDLRSEVFRSLAKAEPVFPFVLSATGGQFIKS